MYSMKEFVVVVALMVALVYGRPQFGGGPPAPSSDVVVIPEHTEKTTPFGNRRPTTTVSSSKPSTHNSSVSSVPSSVSGKCAVALIILI